MTARSNANSIKGFYVAAMGGHNAENHNHNDVGSFMVYADAEPLLIDLDLKAILQKHSAPSDTKYGPCNHNIIIFQP